MLLFMNMKIYGIITHKHVYLFIKYPIGYC